MADYSDRRVDIIKCFETRRRVGYKDTFYSCPEWESWGRGGRLKADGNTFMFFERSCRRDSVHGG